MSDTPVCLSMSEIQVCALSAPIVLGDGDPDAVVSFARRPAPVIRPAPQVFERPAPPSPTLIEKDLAGLKDAEFEFRAAS